MPTAKPEVTTVAGALALLVLEMVVVAVVNAHAVVTALVANVLAGTTTVVDVEALGGVVVVAVLTLT